MRFRANRSSRSRNAGVLAGGIVIGALSSRLLPPVISMVSGSLRTQFGGSPFSLLKKDHQIILSLLASMRDTPDDSLGARTAAFLAFKRKLAKHALAEEDVVYPLLQEHANAADDAKRLYAEHAEMKVHLFELESSLGAVATWRARVRQLDDLIRRHARDEEEREFPRLEQMLDESRLKTVAGQIRREEALVL